MAQPECGPAFAIEQLPGDILARIFSALNPAQLHWAELVCRSFRGVVVQHGVWHRVCIAAHSRLSLWESRWDASLVPVISSAQLRGALPPESISKSAFFKRLYYSMSSPQARESLIACALCASSTDHPQESVDHLLSPEARSRSLHCYWSSRGSADEDSVEVVSFQLAHPLCLVREVDLRPFRAFFQWSNPIYAPKAMRVRLGGLDCFTPQGDPLPKDVLGHAVRCLELVKRAAGRSGAELQVGGLGVREVAGGQQGQGPEGPNGPPHQPPSPPLHPAEAIDFDVLLGGEGIPGPPAAAGLSHVQASIHAALRSARADAERGARLARQALRVQGMGAWVWESEAFPVTQADELQRFRFEPQLCVGGLLQVELIGKVQRQEPDQLYYACLAYVRALGVPVTSFRAALRDLEHPLPPHPSQKLPQSPCHVPPGSWEQQGQHAQQGVPQQAAAALCRRPPLPPPPLTILAPMVGSLGAGQGWRGMELQPAAAGSAAQHADQAGQGSSSQQQGDNGRERGGDGTPAAALACGGVRGWHEFQLTLRYERDDPLKRAGGLARVSEGGRLWRLRQRVHATRHGGTGPGGRMVEGGAGAGIGAELVALSSDQEMWSGSDLGSEDDDGMDFLFGASDDDDFSSDDSGMEGG